MRIARWFWFVVRLLIFHEHPIRSDIFNENNNSGLFAFPIEPKRKSLSSGSQYIYVVVVVVVVVLLLQLIVVADEIDLSRGRHRCHLILIENISSS